MYSRALLFTLLVMPFCTFAQQFSLVKDRIEGAILGAALGDALGRVTEFIATTQGIKDTYGPEGVTSFNSFKKEDWKHSVTGGSKSSNAPYSLGCLMDKQVAPYTDDTVLAKIVLEEALKIEDGELESAFIERLAVRFIDLFGPKKYIIDPFYTLRAHGPTNERSSKELGLAYKSTSNSDQSWWERKPSDYDTKWYADIAREGGCGSVMRAWPLGLRLIIGYDEISQLIHLATEQSMLTHRHPMACAACASVATGVAMNITFAYLFNDRPSALSRPKVRSELVTQSMIDMAACFIEQEMLYKKNAQRSFENCSVAKQLIAQDRLLTADMISYAMHAAQEGKTPEEVLGTCNDMQSNHRSPHGFLLGWAADEAIAAAVYVFMRHPDDLQAALVEAVNTPGDSDSIATLTGALVGSFAGWQSFEQTGFGYGQLEGLAYLRSLADEAYTKIVMQKSSDSKK